MKIAFILATLTGSTAAFAPSSNSCRTSTLSMSDAIMEPEVAVEPPKPAFPTINGWTADPEAFCAGLPGAVAPLGNFDPFGFTKDMPVTEIKRFREAEVTHGRVGMLAVLGYLVGENFHPLFGGQITGPANSHLAQVESVAPFFFAWLVGSIATAELARASIGWVEPIKAMNYNSDNEIKGTFGAVLRAKYYPGDIGFDPFGLKPTDGKEFAEMQTKELNNGRLAMIAAFGMICQEQVTHHTLF
mmetsp:Transcript_2201/g.2978  ORF Transcript_2201/g.2978 Transcript_2201/m.2978 type:complete len:244 (-) Transcript_2201:379-1110(-)